MAMEYRATPDQPCPACGEQLYTVTGLAKDGTGCTAMYRLMHLVVGGMTTRCPE
jgi:hypothetical protein